MIQQISLPSIQPAIHKNFIEYLHCTVGLPVKSTFLQAVNAGNFCSFPGLSTNNMARYCPTNATPTVLGHLTQVRTGIQSTRWTTATNALLAANASHNMLPFNKLLDTMTAPSDTVIFREVPLATYSWLTSGAIQSAQ